MALDLSFLRFSLLPRLTQAGDDEPRRAHFLGRKEASPVDGQQETGGKPGNTPKKSTGKYRDLSDLTLGEVEQALTWLRPQLVPSPAPGWIARNYFCTLPLKRTPDDRPGVVFGRIQTCYPASGELDNIEELEMLFPRPGERPDLLHVHHEEVSPRKPIESYCLGVKTYLSEPEMQDFSRSENIFIEKGFAPLYQTGYSELLDVHEQNHQTLPWLYIIGSEWFAAIPDSMQPEIKEKLRTLVRLGRVVLNYHPKRHTLRYRSLNDELDFQYGFTGPYLLMPHDTGQVLAKVEETFGEKFLSGG